MIAEVSAVISNYRRIVEKRFRLLSSPSATQISLQTSTFQVVNGSARAAMSLIKKSDMKNRLFAGASVYPYGLTRPDSKTDPKADQAGTPPGTNVEVRDISISPSYPIAPEAVPNAQVGGSVGVPVEKEPSGKFRW
jgi:hypothetical protein